MLFVNRLFLVVVLIISAVELVLSFMGGHLMAFVGGAIAGAFINTLATQHAALSDAVRVKVATVRFEEMLEERRKFIESQSKSKDEEK